VASKAQTAAVAWACGESWRQVSFQAVRIIVAGGGRHEAFGGTMVPCGIRLSL
jgi:hypothetical protein